MIQSCPVAVLAAITLFSQMQSSQFVKPRQTVGTRVTLKQETDYPADGRVKLTVSPEKPETFALRIRVPRWSKDTMVTVNGRALDGVLPGTYLLLGTNWKPGDIVEIAFDFSLHFWAGEGECANKISVYRGPILYAYDARYADLDPDRLPALDWESARLENAPWNGAIEPWILATIKDKNGVSFPVCDLSSAGQTGNHYRSWLPAGDLSALPPELAKTADGVTGRTFRWQNRDH